MDESVLLVGDWRSNVASLYVWRHDPLARSIENGVLSFGRVN